MSLTRTLFGDWFSRPITTSLPATSQTAAGVPGARLTSQPTQVATTSATRSVGDITDLPDTNRQNYRSLSGDSFSFWLHEEGAGYRIYLLTVPSYGGRNAGLHETHRIYDRQRKLHFICYDPAPRNKFDALMIAGKWADNTSLYIRNGTTF